MRRLASSLLLLLMSAPAAAQRPAPAHRAVHAALGADAVDACFAAAAWVGAEVRVAVVVFPSGAWTPAVGPVDTVDDAVHQAAQRCVAAALAAALAPRLPRPPSRPRLVDRAVEPPDPRVARVREQIAQREAAMGTCVLRALHAEGALRGLRSVRLQVVFTVAPEGTVRAEIRRARSIPARPVRGLDAARVGRCLALDAVAPAAAAVTVAHTLTAERPRPRGERYDGTEGAICQWGGRRGGPGSEVELYPTPRPCRRGLRCCASGGAAGSDSTCRRGSCPRYP